MRILLAIDESKFSEAAVQTLVRQGPSAGSDVRVLHVIEPTPLSLDGQVWGYALDLTAVLVEQRKAARELVTQAAEKLRAAGWTVSTAVEEGDPKTHILDRAAEWKVDLILVGSHGRKGLDRFLLGSVSESVARHAHCSVEIVRIPAP